MYLYVGITTKIGVTRACRTAFGPFWPFLASLKTMQNTSEKMGPIACCFLHGLSHVLIRGYHKKLLSTRLCTKHIVLDICPMMLYEAKLMMGYDELMMVYDAL